MATDVNVIWIRGGFPYNRIILIDSASEIFESIDITKPEFWDAVARERVGNLDNHEHLKIDVDKRLVEMDGYALRFDWYSVKCKLLKLRKFNWRVIQLDASVISDYPWLKFETPPAKVGPGWHGEPQRHSVKRRVGHIRQKYRRGSYNIDDLYGMDNRKV